METIKFLTPGKISKHKDSEKIDFSSTKVNTFSSSIINDKHPLLLERKLKEKNFHKSLQLSRKDDHEVMSTTSIKSDLESMLLFEKKKAKRSKFAIQYNKCELCNKTNIDILQFI